MSSRLSLLESIRSGLSESIGEQAELQWAGDLPGGDINQAALVQSPASRWFVKYRRNAPPGMFEAEAKALDEIATSGCIRAPNPVAWGSENGTAWLVMEYLELTSRGPHALLGEQLAALHTVTSDSHGWSVDNYIGTTPQFNRRHGNWTEFWRDCRLQPQLAMARDNGFGSRLIDRGERLLEGLDQLLQGHEPVASLLHGDLWAGNKAFTTNGQPVIFDPASYYGDRETDLAMTELFGGFDAAFYTAYQACAALPAGYPLRRELYKLYHVLNHLNLFGNAYLRRSENMIDALLAQVK
jgi:fructosamine-3-kinase